jgi:excisionase family DNA binding protein
MEQRTMTVAQTAVRLGISRNTAYRYCAEGVIPTVRIGRRVLVPIAQLDRMLDPASPTVLAAAPDPAAERALVERLDRALPPAARPWPARAASEGGGTAVQGA